jgi:phosphatidylglycerophosphate synthase
MGKTSEAHLVAGGGAPPATGVVERFRANLAALRAAQKPSRGTAAYSRLVNRPAGRLVAAAVHVLGVTPNGATAMSATLSATGLVLLATVEPTWWLAVAVAALLAGGYVLDSVDGQLARLRGTGSLSGEYLDHSVDCVKTATLHLAVLISWYRFPPLDDPAWLLVPIAFVVVDMMSFFGLVTMPLLRRLHGAPAGATPSAAGAPEHPLRMWLILPTDYGVFCWMFLLLAWPPLFVAGYTAMFAVNALVMVPVLAKWWRELRVMDSTAGTGA